MADARPLLKKKHPVFYQHLNKEPEKLKLCRVVKEWGKIMLHGLTGSIIFYIAE